MEPADGPRVVGSDETERDGIVTVKERAKRKRWRDRHPEYGRAYSKRWREAHPDYGRIYGKRWRAENRNKMNATAARYRERNREVLKLSRGLGVSMPKAREILKELGDRSGLRQAVQQRAVVEAQAEDA